MPSFSKPSTRGVICCFDIPCTPATPTTLASWIIETTPVAKTIVKNPDVNAVCMGTNVAATFTNGSGGSGSDEYEYRVNSGTCFLVI